MWAHIENICISDQMRCGGGFGGRLLIIRRKVIQPHIQKGTRSA